MWAAETTLHRPRGDAAVHISTPRILPERRYPHTAIPALNPPLNRGNFTRSSGGSILFQSTSEPICWIKAGETRAVTDRQLAVIREIASACAGAGIEYWVRGGWAVDFFLGRLTREHEDIDLFAWAEDAQRLVGALEQAGFVEIGGAPPEAQRNMMKDGQEVQIALLAKRDDGTLVAAGGPAAGAPWPEGMLDEQPGHIGDLVCPIVSPSVQIKIKEMFPQWRPDLPIQAKHTEDIARLRAALATDVDR